MSNTQVYTQQFQFPSASTTQPYNYYTPSRGTSPSSSATATPLTSSPTSPHQAHRKMNTPAYVPAVLRPNVQEPRRIKKNPGSAQSTPPGSQSGSLESGDGFPSDTTSIRRRDTMESGKWGLGRMVETSNTGAGPTRDHWKPDSFSTLCDAPTCTKPFSTFNRRHHCRRCGNIFCDSHSSFVVPLDSDASFSPIGNRARACEHCYNEYTAWEKGRIGARALADGKDGGAAAPPAEDVKPAQQAAPVKRGMLARMESIAASVPRDWNWSTF